MMVPTIHINGSDGPRMVQETLDVAQHLDKAIEAMLLICPHGRDFYLQNFSAISEATREYSGRLAKLVLVRDQLRELAGLIQDKIDERKAITNPPPTILS